MAKKQHGRASYDPDLGRTEVVTGEMRTVFRGQCDAAALEIVFLQQEITRLREDARVVDFLLREDISIMWGYTHETFRVYQRDWLFDGTGKNVIIAARVAMGMEQKRAAAEVAEGK